MSPPPPEMRAASTVAKASASIAVLAAALWLGGTLALGAVTAPVIFGSLPAPSSGDVMTIIFRRFDKVAMGCAAIVLLAEVLRAAARERIARLDFGRVGMALIATGLLAWQALVLSPRIEALHRAGAVRGSGSLGVELEAVHRLTESEARVQLFCVAALVVLHIVAVARPRTISPRVGKSASELPAVE